MRFFSIVGVALGAIAFFNLLDVSVQMAIKEQVYACSEVVITDPLSVRRKCGKA